ncbi:Lrp/AsnC family transcriptional regulator [Candidatus Woesearchaeota archaeon]|nr:Lrp/AsnC family transcriptional regulator [Candidatus Woesearchaeota archaeon]
MVDLDKKNCLILNLLQEDCRMSLTDIAKKVGLSVDSVKKRIEKMRKEKIFNPKIQLRPRILGYPYIVDIKVKLHNYDHKKVQSFIEFVVKHPRIAEVFSISGEYDFTLVIIAKNHEDLARVSDEIKKKNSNLISEWSESLTTVAYKFETYDLLKLKEYDDKDRVDPYVW